MSKTAQLDKIRTGNGFIAALDQSGGSTPKALAQYGVTEDAWTNDDEMFAGHGIRLWGTLGDGIVDADL